jgi:hypothetical protein
MIFPVTRKLPVQCAIMSHGSCCVLAGKKSPGHPSFAKSLITTRAAPTDCTGARKRDQGEDPI